MVADITAAQARAIGMTALVIAARRLRVAGATEAAIAVTREGMEAAIGAVMAARKRADHKGAGRSSRRRAIRAGLHQPQAQQSRGSTPYVGRSLWGKQPAQQPENNH